MIFNSKYIFSYITKNKIKNELKKIKMDKVYPIFFQVLKSLGVKHPSEGKQI